MKKDKILKRLWVWQQALGLINWDIKVYFKKQPDSKWATKEYEQIAKTTSHPQYKLGSIYFNPRILDQVDDNVIVHELLHCLMSPLIATACENSKDPESVEYYNEMVVSELDRIITRTLGKGLISK